jgi:hypothetical protein
MMLEQRTGGTHSNPMSAGDDQALKRSINDTAVSIVTLLSEREWGAVELVVDSVRRKNRC